MTPYIIAGYFESFAGILATWIAVGALVMIGGLIYVELGPAAGLAIIAADYVRFFADLSDSAHTMVALSIIALLGLFNYIGIRRAARFQNVTLYYSHAHLSAQGCERLGETLIDTPTAAQLVNLVKSQID